jgi:hypothetical protein
VPLILRKIDEHYVFLRQCYLHGFNRGRILEDIAAGKLTIELECFEVW